MDDAAARLIEYAQAPAEPRVPASAEVVFDASISDTTTMPRGVGFRLPVHTVTAPVARLLARFWDTGSGTVSISGTDVRRHQPGRPDVPGCVREGWRLVSR